VEWWEVLVLLFGSMVAVLLTGLPVAFSFLLVNLVAAYFFLGGIAGLATATSAIFSSLTTFTLLPVPFFILMGEVIFHSGIGLQAIDVVDRWLGKVPGRLSIMAILTGTMFAALSGSTIANTGLLGTLLLPEMRKRGYSKTLSMGPIMGIGGVAMLIPPSALAVVLASLGKMDVGRLLIAGIIPGVLVASLYLSYVVLACLIKPSLAPSYEVPKAPWRERLAYTAKYFLPLGFIIFMVIGVIFLGIATPTEAAATGALGAAVLALFYRKLSWEAIKKSLLGTVRLSTMIFMIIAASDIYSQILAYTGAAPGLVSFVLGLDIPPICVIFGMMIVLIMLGCFMETISIMMITVPVFMPIVNALGFDPIWFGVLMLINLELGFLTPPFGMLLFVMKGISGEDTTMSDVWKAALPFVVADLVGILVLICFPQLALFLPDMMGRIK